MARLSRVTQPIFAASATNTGVFGSAQANGGPGTPSTNIATIMGLAAWAAGWLDAVIGGSKFPALEEFQAIDYVITTQLAYLFQQGIPEYDTGTTYYTNSIVVNPGTYDVYGSNTNGNQGNSLSNATYWTKFGNLSSLGNAPNQFNAGVSTVFANAQVVASTTPATGLSLSNNGNVLIFTAGFTNTGSTTVAVTSPAIAGTTVKKESGGSLVNLAAGDITFGNSIILIVNVSAACWVLSNTLPIGTLAGLGISGNSGVNDGASNYAPAIFNQASTSGASKTYALADWGNLIQRSNSASAMTDTIPGTSGALANGEYFYIENIDTTATDTVSAGASGSFTQGNVTGISAFIVQPGERWLVTAKGSGVYSITRVSGGIIGCSPALFSFTNVVGKYLTVSTINITYDEAVVSAALGGARTILKSGNLTLNITASGANGMDTGTTPTPSVGLFIYLIYNPTTRTAALLGTNAASGAAIYGGVNMPAGYTQSCLISTPCLNGSSQFTPFSQIGGTIYVPLPTIATSLSGVSSIALPAYIPPNAKSHAGQINTSSTGTFGIGGDASLTGGVGIAASNGDTFPYEDVPLLTASTIFYNAAASNSNITLRSYKLW